MNHFFYGLLSHWWDLDIYKIAIVVSIVLIVSRLIEGQKSNGNKMKKVHAKNSWTK